MSNTNTNQVINLEQAELVQKDPQSPPKSDSQLPKELQKEKEATFADLFFFSTQTDKIIVCFASFFSIVQGILLPGLSILFGDITNSFAPSDEDDALDKMMDTIRKQSIQMILVGVGVFFASLIANILWQSTANNQVKTLKTVYFKKLITQNCEWYDTQELETLSTKFITHTDAFEEIFSSKLHIFFMSIGIIVGGFLIGFIKGWLYTLCIVGLTPIMLIGMTFFSIYTLKAAKVQAQAYAEAGAISDQAFTFIKNVKAFNGENHEFSRYQQACQKAKKGTINFEKKAAFFFGIFFFAILLVYGLAFLIGSRLISNEIYNHNLTRDYNVGDILTIFFSITTGIFAFSQLGPVLKSVQGGKLAMSTVFQIMKNNKEEISGSLKGNIKGEIEFKNVTFAYPSKPDQQILHDISFKILPGQKVAFVGPSGCGKSTCIQLLQRYYEPTSGKITLDGEDLQNYDLKFLRNELGLVSQQPILFADTLKNNILMGVDENLKITDEKIEKALEQAQALDFVKSFDKGIDEFVGSLGGQLSGGQKQRIAIARALVREPKIFLFDEATSALDRKNEKEIQNTIDKIADQFTSITIAHRLNTIQNADNIIVFKEGKILEQGNHEKLMSDDKGFYKTLVEGQILDLKVEQNEEILSQEIQDNDQSIHQSLSNFNSLKKSKTSLKDNKENKNQKVTSIYKYLGREKQLIVPALIIAILNGAVMPVFGFLLGKVLGILQLLNIFLLPGIDLSQYDFTKDDLIWENDKYVIGFIVLAVASLFCNFLQNWMFSIIGQTFTARLRAIYFRRLMFKDMSYFDEHGNEPGNISERLSSDCNSINVLVSMYLGTICQSLSSFLVGVVIAFVASWRIALVTLALSPLLIFSGIVESALWANKTEEKKSSNTQLSESLNNIKVVKSLTAEKNIYDKFDILADTIRKKNIKQGFLYSFLLSISQMSQFIVYALVFWVGAVFVKNNGLSFENLMIAVFSILFGSYGAGMANQFLGNVGKAKASSIMIMREIDEPSKIEFDKENPQINPLGTQRIKPQLSGKIEFKNVYFKYAGRKNWVLRNVSFIIDVGQSHAFVGGSGSGKSTVFQLVQRFYDIQHGEILFDNQNIKLIDLQYLRSIFGVVRQEPYLFNGTIRYNIKYNDDKISDEKMIEAAKQSNSYDFIMQGQDKFDRDVGNRGEQLSGGQKQRINIARCLARNPLIFLFDEATSALDSLSEEQVQEAIEKVSQGCTSMTIAHRISTIQNSNMIFVFEDGKILERGNYQQLIKLGKIFFELANN